MLGVIFVSSPFAVAKVFQMELFGVFLALSLAVATLSTGLRQPEFSAQIDLDPFPHFRSDGRLWTPGAAETIRIDSGEMENKEGRNNKIYLCRGYCISFAR